MGSVESTLSAPNSAAREMGRVWRPLHCLCLPMCTVSTSHLRIHHVPSSLSFRLPCTPFMDLFLPSCSTLSIPSAITPPVTVFVPSSLLPLSFVIDDPTGHSLFLFLPPLFLRIPLFRSQTLSGRRLAGRGTYAAIYFFLFLAFGNSLSPSVIVYVSRFRIFFVHLSIPFALTSALLEFQVLDGSA